MLEMLYGTSKFHGFRNLFVIIWCVDFSGYTLGHVGSSLQSLHHILSSLVLPLARIRSIGVRAPMQAREIAIIKRLHKVIRMLILKIATALGRHKKSVDKALNTVLSRGRANSLSSSDVRHIVTVLKQLVKKAKTRYEVTLSMVKKAAKANVCLKTIRRALASKGIQFRRLRPKPNLTKDDIKARLLFAAKYKGKSTVWWQKNIHMAIDCKTFPAYVTARARSYAAQREIRGVYRQLGQGIDDAYVVAPKELKFNPGCTAVKIVAAGRGGRMLDF